MLNAYDCYNIYNSGKSQAFSALSFCNLIKQLSIALNVRAFNTQAAFRVVGNCFLFPFRYLHKFIEETNKIEVNL